MVSFRQALRPLHHDDPATPVVRLVVPVTGADSDKRLLEIVERIAHRQRADISLVYVVEVIQSMPLDAELPVDVERGEQILQAARETIVKHLGDKKSTAKTELLQARSAGVAIVDESIDRQADVILMSAMLTRKHGKISVGDTTNYVLRNAPCEVIVIRQEMPDWLMHSLEVEPS